MPTKKFEAGVSGNPKGRPKDKTIGYQLRKAIELRADDILQAVINAAINGDMAACKMLLDRITPTLKPQATPICLAISENVAEQGREIINSILSGECPADVGLQLFSALADQEKMLVVQHKKDDAAEVFNIFGVN